MRTPLLVLLVGFTLAASVMAPVKAAAGESLEPAAAREADIEYKPVEGPPTPTTYEGSEFPGGDGVVACVAVAVTVGAILVLAIVLVLTILAGESLSKATGVELSPWQMRSEPRGLGAIRHRGFEPPSGMVLLRF